MGPCRVYRIDPDTGTITGYFDLPPACGHAGGLAYAGSGVLILSDTRRLYRINLEQALREQRAHMAITGTLELAGALRGSFVTVMPVTVMPVAFVPAVFQPETKPTEGPGLFLGAWSTSASKARGYFLPLSLFDSHTGTTITEDNAFSSIPLGARAQGGAFAPNGSFWISYSSHDFGRVQRVDPASGQVLASYALVSGTEDISFDGRGGLWAVSEAGSLRWRSWRTSFPVVFRLDPELLK
jgi:DNA-binding beta-propeller fold protein YncE